jgi:hypothetical protein
MSPEAITKKQFSEKSDVWAFAITMLEIYTRRDPYPDMEPIHVVSGICQEENPLRPSAPKDMSPAFAAMWKRSINTDPADRPTFKEINSVTENNELFQ